MADNYLERKMEEHRRGGARAYRPAVTTRGSRPGVFEYTFTPRQVWMGEMTADSPLLPLARALVGIGFKVTFTDADINRGHRLATTLGARCLPPSMLPDADAIFINKTPLCYTLSRNGVEMDINLTAEIAGILFIACQLANL